MSASQYVIGRRCAVCQRLAENTSREGNAVTMRGVAEVRPGVCVCATCAALAAAAWAEIHARLTTGR
jgi:hypothetical protein